MKKKFPNRTIGLQNKVIEETSGLSKCEACKGTGKIKHTLAASTIRNIQASGEIELEDDCGQCVDGFIANKPKLRVVRKKSKLSAIL